MTDSSARYLHDPEFHAHVVTAVDALVRHGLDGETAVEQALVVCGALFPTEEQRRAAEAQAETLRRQVGGVTDDRADPGLRQIGVEGMQAKYLVLSDEERAKGFVRPVRRSYRHEKCGTVTTMGQAIAETYARDPSFYGGTYCAGCRDHFPVGASGEFYWDGSYDEKVGT